jgi:anti-sigma factor RsiW
LNEHLTQKQGEDYCRQQLPAQELLAVSDHLGECEACRQQVERALDSDAAFFALRSEAFGEAVETPPLMREHPTLEQTAGYVDGRLGGEELQVLTDHLSSCEHCALVVDDLRSFRNQIGDEVDHEYQPVPARAEGWRHRVVASLPPIFQRSPALAFGTALTVLLLGLTGIVIWRALQAREAKQEIVVTPTPPPSEDGAPPPPVIAQLNDGEGAITLDREGKLSGADHLPPAYQSMLKDALMNQRLERSPLLKGLVRPSSALMSGDKQGNTFSVLEPVGRVLLSDGPTFRWSPLNGATGYIVEVYDEKFNLVATSPQLTEHSWTAPQPLRRGGIYSWQVNAIKDSQEIKSPRPPARQAKFRILDPAKANELAQARRTYASSHLALGLLYAQAGLLEESQQEFRALQKANPNSEIARRLLENVPSPRR